MRNRLRYFLTTIAALATGFADCPAETWQAAGTGLEGKTIQVLAADPSDATTLYAGAIAGGAYRRQGTGAWTVLSDDFAFDTITALAVSPADGNVILLGTEEFGAHVSGDGGATWRLVAAGGQVAFVRRFRFSPHDPTRVVAATEGEGIFLSVDAGVNWATISADVISDFTRDVIFHPTDARTLYASATGLDEVPMRVSFDDGDAWRDFGVGITSTVTALGIGTTDPNVIYAGTTAGVFASTDGGTVFSAVPFGENPVEVRALVVDPTNHLRVVAATDAGVFVTADGGANWMSMNEGLPTTDVRALIASPTNPHRLYAGVVFDGVFTIDTTPAVLPDVDADFDGSGSVDFADFLRFVAAFGRSSGDEGFDAPADLDGSGAIDFSDFLLFVAVFGT